jgi:hypothetical protein
MPDHYDLRTASIDGFGGSGCYALSDDLTEVALEPPLP